MKIEALLNMIFMISTLWGGLIFVLILAIRKEKKDVQVR